LGCWRGKTWVVPHVCGPTSERRKTLAKMLRWGWACRNGVKSLRLSQWAAKYNEGAFGRCLMGCRMIQGRRSCVAGELVFMAGCGGCAPLSGMDIRLGGTLWSSRAPTSNLQGSGCAEGGLAGGMEGQRCRLQGKSSLLADSWRRGIFGTVPDRSWKLPLGTARTQPDPSLCFSRLPQ